MPKAIERRECRLGKKPNASARQCDKRASYVSQVQPDAAVARSRMFVAATDAPRRTHPSGNAEATAACDHAGVRRPDAIPTPDRRGSDVSRHQPPLRLRIRPGGLLVRMHRVADPEGHPPASARGLTL